jgi:acetyl/propionyl-CoA carboxylase alpha subunit
MRYIATVDGIDFLIEIVDEQHIHVNETDFLIDFDAVGNQPVFSLIMNGQSYEAYVYPEGDGWQVLLHGRLYTITVEDEREKRLRAAAGGKVADRGEFHLKAPMPGLVIGMPVKDGDKVEKGDVLLILESMKMQNELKSPRAGIVSRIRTSIGESVEQNQTLMSVV